MVVESETNKGIANEIMNQTTGMSSYLQLHKLLKCMLYVAGHFISKTPAAFLTLSKYTFKNSVKSEP